MRRSPSSVLFASCLAGCAFSDGQPFGVAELSLTASFPETGARRTPEGRVKTDLDYAVDVQRLAVAVESIRLDVRSGAEASSFDPARPPPGFSLCHNGHCHAEDGRLVPYEEIAAQAGGASTFSVMRAGAEGRVDLSAVPVEVALLECAARCQLQRGDLSAIGVQLHELELEVVVFDRRADSRLPADGLPFSAELVVEAELSAPLEGRVDDGEALGVRTQALLALPESVFDGIDWIDGSTASAVLDQIKTNLEESEALSVEVERYDR